MEKLNKQDVKGIKSWLLFYIIFSIPVLLFYSAGLSGWFFEYPLILLFTLFIFLAIPLVLILLKSPKAPQWNIVMLWISASLIILRIISGIFFQTARDGQPQLSDNLIDNNSRLTEAMPILLGIVVFSLAWTIIWTIYFKKSARVKNTFGK